MKDTFITVESTLKAVDDARILSPLQTRGLETLLRYVVNSQYTYEDLEQGVVFSHFVNGTAVSIKITSVVGDKVCLRDSWSDEYSLPESVVVLMLNKATTIVWPNDHPRFEKPSLLDRARELRSHYNAPGAENLVRFFDDLIDEMA